MKILLGENIRKCRKKLGYTQEQLAEAMQVTVGAVSKWESGATSPDLSALIDLADLFEVSVDVLLGYQMQDGSRMQAVEKIESLKKQKRYEEGCKEAEKALLKYPNCFDVVRVSASLYSVKGIEFEDEKALERSLALYERSLSLIDQNTSDEIDEMSIRNSIVEIYFSLGKADRAIEELKKRNFDKVNSGMIGYFMSISYKDDKEKCEEALNYLSEGAIDCITQLLRIVVGYANCFINTGKPKKAIEVMNWLVETFEGLKEPGKITYLDKLDVTLLSGCAECYDLIKDYEQAENYLRRAARKAREYDANPVITTENMKYMYGEHKTVYDSMGESAFESLERSILSNEDPISPELMAAWEKIMNER